jgi:hypothetical protein
MKKGEPTRLDALEALIAEKRKHEGYLAKLDERREGTPEHVYKRLRDEYLTKLTDAQVKAQMEAETVGDALDEDEAAIVEIEDKLAKLQEEKVEGELRAAVGEIEPKEWTKKLTALTAGITMGEKDRDARREQLDRMRALLDEAMGGAPAPSASKRAPTPAAGVVPPHRATSAMATGPNFDELAFLNAVAGRTSTPGVPVPRESKPVETVKETPAEPTKAVAKETPAEATKQAPSEPADEAETAPIVESPSAEAKKAAAPPAEPVAEKPKAEPAKKAAPPAEEESDSFGRPTPRTTQAVKTLKCQECGTFNYPTEWYCERCGGELAAL